MANSYTDVELPRSVLSSWREDGKPRASRRALAADERRALEARRDELLPAVEPHGSRDVDRVAAAIAGMYGGFPSMRQQGDDAVVSRLDAARRALAPFPAWAIESACSAIQRNGVWRDGKLDRRWPPSDAEIAQQVRQELRLYSDTLRRVVEVLEAQVEHS